MNRAYCSYTAQPNTPETDALPEVPHIVQVNTPSGPEKVLVLASAPDDAIRKVNSMTETVYQSLQRV